VLTIHNIGYQGLFDADVLDLHGIGDARAAIAPDALVDGLNFLRAGVRGADIVTTVSPTYAKEIVTPEFGMGLEDALLARGDDVVGILNGVDYDTWGPETDPYIDVRYDATDLAPKYRLKGAVSKQLGLLPDQNAPLVGFVSRLAAQKGIDLVVDVLPTLLAESRASFAFLGSGDGALAADLRALALAHPRRVSFTDGYSEPLAHQILAGSDLALVPSRYEPCGLTQMYALRYGTIPVVRATGGLADTVHHYDPVVARGNGAVFRDADAGGLLWAIRAALAWFDEPRSWARLVANAMSADFSWRKQVRPYEALYKRCQALHVARGASPLA
jgi:starch synthase